MKFSEREGIKPARTAFQIQSVDKPLRNSLWNVLQSFIIEPILDGQYLDDHIFLHLLWVDHYQCRADERPEDEKGYFEYGEERIFQGEWHEVYDFIQFCLDHVP